MHPISIIITTYNNAEVLDLCLGGFAKQTTTDFMIHIVDDGGDIDLQPLIIKHSEKLRLQYHYLDPPTTEFRAAAARNLGLKFCDTPRVLFQDGDCVPERDIVAGHAKYGDQKLLVNSNRQEIPHWKRTIPHGFLHSDLDYRVVVKTRTNHNNYEIYYRDSYCAEEDRIIHAWEEAWSYSISMPCGLVKSIGGFWEEFVGWGGEDAELAMRMVKLGCRVCLRPDLMIYHLSHPRRIYDEKEVSRLFRKSRHMDTLIRNGGPIT